MWQIKLKRKKVQYLLVALILFITAAAFSACFGFTMESFALVKKSYSGDHYPDVVLAVSDEGAYREIEAAAKKSGTLEITAALDFFWLDGKMSADGRDVADFQTSIRKLERQEDLFSDMELVRRKDESAAIPGDDEIWMTKVYSDAKNLKLGDSLFFEDSGKELTITGIFKTLECPNAVASSLYPFYVNANTFQSFHALRDGKILAFDEAGDRDVVTVLKETMGNDYQTISPFIMQFSSRIQMSAGALQVSGLLGGLGILAGIIVFIVATVIIQYIIRTNLMKEYKCIGTYKALGFSNKKIRGIYARGYLFIGLLAVILGALSAIPMSAVMGASINADMIGYELASLTAAITLVTIFLLNAILMFAVARGTRKIKKIYPVDAFRIGSTSTRKKLKKSFIPFAHTPFAFAVNDIVRRGHMSVMTVVVLSLSLFITTFFVGINYSCKEMGNNISNWYALPLGDVYSGVIDKAAAERIEEDERVSYSCYGTFVSPPFMSFDEKYDLDEVMESSLFFTSRSNASPEGGYHCNVGRMPRSDSEVAVSKTILRELGLSVGDYLDFNGKDQERFCYLISGEFSSMMGNGRLVMFTYSEMEARGVNLPIDFLSVRLKPGTDRDQFIEEMKAAAPGVIFGTSVQMIDDIALGVVGMTGPMSAVLVLILFMFSLLNIVNLAMMDNADNRRSYGIMKALGFKTSYLIQKAVIRIGLLSLLSMGISMGLYACLSAPIFRAMLDVNGFIYNYPASVAIIGAMFALTIAATLLCCLSTRTISPTELMEE